MLPVENFVLIGSKNSTPSKLFGCQHNIKTPQLQFSLVLDVMFSIKRNRSTLISLKFSIISFTCEIKRNKVCKFCLLYEITQDKIGSDKCNEHTITGIIGIEYYGKIILYIALIPVGKVLTGPIPGQRGRYGRQRRHW